MEQILCEWLWFDLHCSQLRPGVNTTVRWPQWVAQGAKLCVWRHQQQLLTSSGDQRGYGLGWDSEPIYVTTLADGVGKNERGNECDSCAQSRAHSQKWDVKGRRRSKRWWGKLKESEAGTRERLRKSEGQVEQTENLLELRKSSMGDSGRRWQYAEFIQVSAKLFWQVTLMWNIKPQWCPFCFSATWETKG